MPDDQRVTTEDADTAKKQDQGDDDTPRQAPREKDNEDKDDKQNDDDDNDSDENDDESKEKKPSFIRRHPIWILLGFITLIAVAVVGYFVWLIYFHPYETTDDAFVDARQFSISAKVAGYVLDVPVTDNQHVEAGDVILKIDPRDYQVALDQAKGQVDSAKASIESADAQIAAANSSVDEAKAQLNSVGATLQFARDENSRQQQLVKTGAGTVQAAQQAGSTLQQNEANFASTQASLTSAIKNVASAQAQKASAIASLRQGEAQVKQAELNLSYTTIVAAQSGRVVQLSGAKGQYLQAGQSVSMYVPDETWVTANYKETQITDMRPGQPVDVSIDAYPDHPLRGTIDSVQPGSGTAFSLLPAENATGNYVKVVQRVPVKIVIDKWPTDISIGPGMSVVPTATVRPKPAYSSWFGQ